MKIIKKSNFRVVIEPRRLGDYGYARVSDSFTGRSEEQIAKDYQERCEQIIDEIKRHVDNVGWTGVEFDSEEICSHCRHSWDVSDDDSDPEYPKGTPLCCEKAIQEFKSK